MAKKPTNPNDLADQERKAQSDADKVMQEQARKGTESDATDTPSAAELLAQNPDVFGAETQSGEKASDDDLTPQDRQFKSNLLTKDEKAAVGIGEGNKVVKDSDGNEVPIHTRVMLHTKGPIGGQTENPAYVIGYSPNGGLNLRLEYTDGSRGAMSGQDFGNVKQDKGDNDADPYWTKIEPPKEE